MQFPYEWYIYVVPGGIILACILLWLSIDQRIAALKLFRDNAVAALPIAFVASFILGFSSDTAITTTLVPVVRMLSNSSVTSSDTLSNSELFSVHRDADKDLVRKHSDAYQYLIFLRLLACSMILLFVSTVCWMWRRKIPKHLSLKTLIIVLLLLIDTTLVFQYFRFRPSYKLAQEAAVKSGQSKLEIPESNTQGQSP